jgi:hypothetical protein
MDVSFVETMRGTLQTQAGVVSAVEFDLVAFAPQLGRFLFDGRTEVRGLLRAPAWADETPVRGTLIISRKTLEYRVEFRGRGGERYVLEGVKHPTVLRPVASMTQMKATLREADGRLVAEGEMSFDVRDLASFALSWLPVGKRAQRSLDAKRRAVERLALT